MEENRVLSRVGARLVSEEELQQIAGGFIVRGGFLWQRARYRSLQL